MYQVKATCPTRVDLAGGTIDLWPIYLCLDHSATVNVSIDVPAQAFVSLSDDADYTISSVDQDIVVRGSYQDVTTGANLALLEILLRNFWKSSLPPISLETAATSPAGAGLGGSSCLAVAVLKALLEMRQSLGDELTYSATDLVNWVQNCEAQLIKSPPGCQDYWGGMGGGINIIRYKADGHAVSTIRSSLLDELEESLLVVFSGEARFSGLNNWSVYRHFFDHEVEITAALEAIGELGVRCADAMASGNMKKALQISCDEWQVRKKMWPGVETERTKSLESIALANGAWFSRVCGAGGGGAMLIVVDREHRNRVATELTKAGAVLLTDRLDRSGLRVECLRGSSL